MFVELHMIQNFAPSCLNRDDTNTPKDCEFGGHRRARISSQCFKRAIRRNPIFADTIGMEISDRTKLLPRELASMLIEEGKDEETAVKVAEKVVHGLCKTDTKERTKVLLFLGKNEVAAMKDSVIEHWTELTDGDDKSTESVVSSITEDLITRFREGPLAPDIALFGRMVAEKTMLNVDAACQVAHAFSTNKAGMEMDFYTAVDDLNPKEDTGAGMMGTIEFNSSCFYRYSVVDTGQLMVHLGGDKELTLRTVEGFIKSSVTAIPTGKQNSMAAHNLPSLVLVLMRPSSQPWSLANAFAVPVRATPVKGLIEASIERLDTHFNDMATMYGLDGVDHVCYSTLGAQNTPSLDQIGVQYNSIEELIKSVRGALDERIAPQD